MDVNTCLATTEAYRDLALYSHLIPALATFILGLFAYIRAEHRAMALYFLAFSTAFTAWLIADLVVWTANDYNVVAAFWEPLDYIEILFFLLLFGFIATDLFARAASWLRPILILCALVPFYITFTGRAVLEMYQPTCEMVGNDFLAHYKVWLETAILAATLILGIYRAGRRGIPLNERIRVGLITTAVVLFMGIFSWSEFIATTTDVFEINLYALFTLPIFVALLTIAITSYGTFKLGDAAVKALFYVFLVLAATQFFFAGDVTEFMLAAMSFAVVFTLGIMLFFTSEREIKLRHVVEKQATELEAANKQQESLLHFISHEVKGYLTKSEAGFAGIVEGDFGAVPETLKNMAGSALADTRKGVATVMEILSASNMQKGTVQYKKEDFDLTAAVKEELSILEKSAKERGVSLVASIPDESFRIMGDTHKIADHLIRNLIDNAIKYSPKGSVRVTLSRTDGHVRFSVKDTGVGLSEDDKKTLFTEGGKGKDSLKVNVDSTGYGLYIAKQVVEAHGGKIWAESEGRGRGSLFVVELPVKE
ncbi:HAMP domain-containing histidine kinase [Candidatus Kaiserbacteria bacterium]|nr:HAMP domain-containing histidine kinase [Candidatus Kaiserbacteria bacterium]